MPRNVVLAAWTSLDYRVRVLSDPRPSWRVLIAGALLGAGVLAALVHLAGDELKVWLASGQNGAMPAFIGLFSDDSGTRPG
jgi:hypothetical protein